MLHFFFLMKASLNGHFFIHPLHDMRSQGRVIDNKKHCRILVSITKVSHNTTRKLSPPDIIHMCSSWKKDISSFSKPFTEGGLLVYVYFFVSGWELFVFVHISISLYLRFSLPDKSCTASGGRKSGPFASLLYHKY